MLAMPVPTTILDVAARRIDAWVTASFPVASPTHTAPNPSRSNSATASLPTPAGRHCRWELHKPTGPTIAARRRPDSDPSSTLLRVPQRRDGDRRVARPGPP